MSYENRTEIIKRCLNRPFKLVFTPLGDYEDLDWEFATRKEAEAKLAELIKNKAGYERYGGFHAEILKRLKIESKEVVT